MLKCTPLPPPLIRRPFTDLRMSKIVDTFVEQQSCMIVTFSKEYLKTLYTEGRSTEKKHRFQPNIIKRYKRCIDYLKAATNKETLFLFNSLNFEALKGDKAGLFSIRVNDQYRIEFTMQESPKQPILTICNIVELTNHYD